MFVGVLAEGPTRPGPEPPSGELDGQRQQPAGADQPPGRGRRCVPLIGDALDKGIRVATLCSSGGMVVAMTAVESHQASAHAPRKIMICLDGTGNQMKAKGHTNVAALYQMLDLSDPTMQLGYYDPGVGTMSSANARGASNRWFSRTCGLAFGSGLKTNLAEAYTFLMQHW
jgi:type VI secretion system (T6SS) phospholipase Tle1-like effector